MTTDLRGAPATARQDTRDDQETSRGPEVARAVLTFVLAYVALSGVLIGLGLLLMHFLAPVHHWDDHVNSWFAARRTPGWDRFSKGGTFVANTLGVVVVAAVVTLFAILRRWGRMATLLGLGLALEISVFLTVNYSVARPRPSAPHLGSTPSTYSFPSGHVAATFVLYGGIAVLVASRTRVPWARVLAWVIAAVLVGWVAFSRVYEAQHHPSDVIAGLCLGIGAVGGVVRVIRRSGPAVVLARQTSQGREPQQHRLTRSPNRDDRERTPQEVSQ